MIADEIAIIGLLFAPYFFSREDDISELIITN